MTPAATPEKIGMRDALRREERAMAWRNAETFS